ncbi:MarR family winged helix-turn-helix transcriptional regulator [Arthrobacter sp. NPDC057388]|uniref:MarR family winged helix-turn-helix transcriptional regulator n=1 Tax=Arthrobacter sp. NPDC057388 TaxID=3346116 RepID=UPI003631FE9B
MVPNPDADQWGPHQLLSMAARLVQRRQDQALAELGLTHAAVIALQGLLDGPLNQEQLAADIKVRSQSIGRVLSRLEGAGLVSRASSSQDRRHNEVSITEAGRQALEAARKAEREALPPDVVGGTVLGRELARVISYFPVRAKPGPDKPRNAPADGAPDEGAADDGAPVEGASVEGAPDEAQTADAAGGAAKVSSAAAGVSAEAAPAEGAPPSPAADAPAEPDLRAVTAADGVTAQHATPAAPDSRRTQKPHGKSDPAPA